MGAPSDMTVTQKLAAIRERMEKGQALFIAGDYQAAAAVFEDGYQIYPYAALLFNAGVCYQKLGRIDKALGIFRKYLSVDPNSPGAARVKQRIAELQAALAGATHDAGAPPSEASAGDAGAARGDAGPLKEGGAPAAAEAGAPPAPPNPAQVAANRQAMKSLVVVETEPPSAPMTLFERMRDNAAVFRAGGPNPGWQAVYSARSPADITLDAGHYHIVVAKFRDFNSSETDIDVSPGQVYHFKANLSQGAFMAFLRVSANVRGAHIYLDDPQKRHLEWGRTPFGELVSSGKHDVLVEAPGFQPFTMPVDVSHGQQKEIEVHLVRVGYGYLSIDGDAPNIRVEVDHAPVGVWQSGAPPLRVKLTSGNHLVTIHASGRKTYEGLVRVPRGQVLPVRARLIPTYPRGPAWTQAVIGAAFIGAAIYFGTESNRLNDQLEADRAAGVLQQDDSRITRGRWYAVGADAGFAIGGVLGILATYNFIKDPLPPSSARSGRPREFPDSQADRPAALRVRPSRPARVVRRSPGWQLGVSPMVGKNAGGLFIGGRF
jgi:Tetratricopeptide repeat/PEGA domain